MNSSDSYYLIYDTGVSNLELEEMISKDGFYSYDYALYVLKCRFRLGEKIIVKYSYYSCEYLVRVLGYDHE